MNTPPLATYRLQFTPDFGFRSCREILDYLCVLGVSDVYASPIFKARPGSAHGYDVCDPRKLNPELGTERDFNGLMAAVQGRSLGWVQDIVPNHMAVSGHNRVLADLLENGPVSRYFSFFDVDWDHPYEGIRGRMLAPFLGGLYGDVLERGEIVLGFDADGLFVRYYDLRLPIRLDSYPRVLTLGLDGLRLRMGRDNPDYIKLLGALYSVKGLPEEPGRERYDQITFIKGLLFDLYEASPAVREFVENNLARFNGLADRETADRFGLLHDLLSEQYFRLSFWKVAAEEINYRRFFSINDLISLRVEQEEVFDFVHGFVLEKIGDGLFSGLRVDHIDGLYDPAAYLRRLRERCGEAYLVVEKILEPGEPLPEFWPVQGTTGYDFLNAVCGLFAKGENERAFERTYTRFIGRRRAFSELLAEKKRFVADRHMAGDAGNLARLIYAFSGHDRRGSDMTMNVLKQAVRELLVHFPVYRTYIDQEAQRSEDTAYIRTALAATRASNPDLAHELDYLERFLLLDFDDHIPEERRREWVGFVMRFQQLTGPLMAKGLEDAVFYVANRLLCLNEVGGRPDRFGLDGGGWLDFIRERMRLWPHAMNATATHDTKRGEDARMRLAALSELPEQWERALKRLTRVNARKKRKVDGEPAPDRNDEYFLYQTLLASWPCLEEERGTYPDRLKAYLIKAVREAKEHSAWIKPNEGYEQAYTAFAGSLLRKGRNKAFLATFLPLQRKVARLGMVNSLSQTLLKLVAPGVPDFYQGTELWDLALVDPDNRRPVDFGLRMRLLEELGEMFQRDPPGLLRSLLARPEDGRIKLFLIWRLLAARRSHARLFQEGDCRLLPFEGRRADNLFGFSRRMGNDLALAVFPRFVSGFLPEDGWPIGDVWEDARLVLSEPTGPLTDVVTGRTFPGGSAFEIREVLETFPGALLIHE